ncbi:MAG TPA: p-hydroxycinnamoyl CoA hydratase/lyase [Chloroflexota bacterium]|jgi:trans-feruloyl-CoA hydratase/vanillin synthase|nr:p-hydroxycinnamoyl CoA hydratase/lyase [Chloroflexota bacterium]
MAASDYQTVKIERDSGVTFLYFNRPEKRNAMSPQLCAEMVAALSELEVDDRTDVLVLTGAGEAFSAGMDLREYFRGLDNDPAGRLKASWDARLFHYYKLRQFPKPTIAMVNGWCFGGAFSPLTSCDFAIAAEDAVFGLSEVNWGIVPGGFVSRDVVLTLRYRDALWYALTGEPFDGKRAAEIGLINLAVPREQLRDTVMALARKLQAISPAVLRATKEAIRNCMGLSYDQAWDYLAAKNDQLRLRDPERSRDRGIQQFIDEKVYRPGLGPQPRAR